MLRRRLLDSRGYRGDTLDLLELPPDGEPPAFATDEEDRIVFWNSGAEKVFGRSGPEVLGRPCFSVVRGRDLQGNHFCYRDCPVVAQRRIGESLSGCEVVVPTADGKSRTLSVTLLQLPEGRQDGAALVHLLKPVERESILGQALTRAGLVGLPLASRPSVQPPLTSRETEILRWVAAATVRERLGMLPGTPLTVMADDGAVTLTPAVPPPRLARRHGRLVARPVGDRRLLPKIDIAKLIEEERNRWP